MFHHILTLRQCFVMVAPMSWLITYTIIVSMKCCDRYNEEKKKRRKSKALPAYYWKLYVIVSYMYNHHPKVLDFIFQITYHLLTQNCFRLKHQLGKKWKLICKLQWKRAGIVLGNTLHLTNNNMGPITKWILDICDNPAQVHLAEHPQIENMDKCVTRA